MLCLLFVAGFFEGFCYAAMAAWVMESIEPERSRMKAISVVMILVGAFRLFKLYGRYKLIKRRKPSIFI